MPITNLVEVVVDREKLKWDAIWHLLAWLLDPKEAHALGEKILEAFCLHVFGQPFPLCPLDLEYQLSPVKDGKGKWVDLALAIPSFDAPTHIALMDDIDRRSPGSRRKLDNLKSYRDLALRRFPDAIIRLVVLTNANDGTFMKVIYEGNALGREAETFDVEEGWKLLPLRAVGGWVETAQNAAPSLAPEKMKLFLGDFVEWSKSLDHRPSTVLRRGVAV